MHNSPYGLLVFLIPLAAAYPMARIFHWLTNRWKVIVEGVYVSAEDGQDTYTKRPTMLVPYGRKVRRTKTTIRFDDGRTFVLRPRAKLPVQPGSRIRITSNRWEGHRIDIA